jgi:NitT/TauT family transport system substrate-binding protein
MGQKDPIMIGNVVDRRELALRAQSLRREGCPMERVSRPAFLAGGLAALAAPTFAADLTTLRVAGTPDADLVGTLWGEHSGIFQRAGLDVHVDRLNSGGAVSAGVIGGSIDIGKSSVFGLITAYVKGVPLLLEAVADVYDSKSPNTAFVVAKNSTINGPHDLAGKTLASPALGDLFSTVSANWIDANGGNSHASNFVELPIPLVVNAIAAGRVDGAILVNPYLQIAKDSGACRVIGHPFDMIAKFFGVTYYFCAKPFAQANVDVLARFRRGLTDASNYALAHQHEMAPVIVDYTKLDRALIDKLPLGIGIGMNPSDLQAVIDYAARIKSIPASFPAADIIDPNVHATP